MVGTTLILFEGLPPLSLVTVAIGRTKTACGIAKAVGTAGVDEALAVDGMVGAIGIVAASDGGINLVRAYLSSS